MTTMLIFLGTAFFTLAGISGTPTRYDQRQEGDFNLHTKFENFLFVVAIPSNSEALADLALQTLSDSLALKQQLSRSNSPKDQEPIKSGEEIRSEEPYSVEIIRIDENPSNERNSARRAGEESTAKVLIGNKGAEKARSAKSVKNLEFFKSREVPTIVGFLLDPRKMHAYKTEDGGRARNVLRNIWNPADEPARPGTSLKKQLLRREEEEDVAPSSPNADRNDVAPLSTEKQELMLLLGDETLLGIENCGPGRHRDASGVCQFDSLNTPEIR